MNSITPAEVKERMRSLSPLQRKALLKILKESGVDTAQFETIEPRKAGQPIELSFAQQRLWFLSQLEENTATYTVPLAMALNGELNRAALIDSIKQIVVRHEVLRTRFVDDGSGYPHQIIDKPEGFEVEVEKLDNRDDLKSVCELAAKKPFNLSDGPLLRVKLLILGDKEHVLLITLHHTICDGWSLTLFFQELVEIYRALSANEKPQLPALAIQYADFSLWQRGWLTGDVIQSLENYWKKQLAGLPPVLELPTDRPRPAVLTNRGAHEIVLLSKELQRQLNEFSLSHKLSLFMTTLAAYHILLSRYSGQTDIAVGTPIANRSRPELEDLIGLFANTLVLRADLSGDPTIDEFLQRVRGMTHDAYAHQDMPFEQLVHLLQPTRSLSFSPLFQAAFTLKNSQPERFELPKLSLAPVDFAFDVAKFDIALALQESPGGLQVSAEYNRDLFDAATIRRMLSHYERILTTMVDSPAQKVAALNLLSNAERRQLVSQWNDTASSYPKDKCLHTLFAEQVARTPNAIAATYNGEQLTYAQLDKKTNQLAHYLIKRGVKSDVVVGIAVERSLEMIVGLMGILKAGGAYAPLDPHYPQDRLSYMLEDCGTPVLLTQQALVGSLPSFKGEVICLDNGWESIAQESEQAANVSVAPHHLAYVIYTSGSTGKPKGVMNQHDGVVNRLIWMQEKYGLTAADVVLQKTSFSFDVSVWEFFWPLIAGASIVFAKPEGHKDNLYLIDLIKRERVSTLHFVPSMLSVMLGTPQFAECVGIKRVFCSGEALSVEHVRQFSQLLPRTELHNLYGPTEAAIDVSYWPCEYQPELSTVPIGKPVANTQLYVLDEHLQPVPVGVSGELYIGGVQLARGYLNKPELTTKAFIPNPLPGTPGDRLYKTGDVARYLADGNIEYLGRRDHQVKIRGFRIELGEIESLLLSHASVQACAVLAREDVPGDKRLVAYVVLTGGSNQSLPAELRDYVQSHLPDHMVPGAYVMLSHLPVTANGKLDRKALPAPDLKRSELGYVAPRTALETQLAAIWADVLHLDKVGVHDNFFELGGHSLMVTQVISRARLQGMNISMRQVFEGQTVAAVCQSAAASGASRNDQIAPPPLVLVERPQYLPLSFSQRRLWIVSKVKGQESSYNLPSAMLLEGSLSVASLHAAFVALIRRHATLRTVFLESVDKNGGQPYQYIIDEFDFFLDQTDLSGLSAEGQQQRVQEMANADAMEVFDLSRDLMIRASLLKLSDTRHVLLLNLNHIASDGWSINILLKELNYFYDAYQQGIEPNLPPLPLQYADYALWQQRWMQGEVLEAHQRYWREALAGIPQLHNLPLDNPRPAQRSYRGAKHLHRLGIAKSQALKQFNQQQGVTLFMTLQAVFATLISRFSGEEDVVIGFSLANRVHQEIEGLIGFFANTLVLRSNLSGNPRFVDFLQATKEHSLTALTHQHLPFELLVEELNPERSLSHSPLFQIMLVVDNNPFDAPSESELSVTAVDQSFPISKFDLSLHVRENPDEGFVLNWGYATDLFAAASIQRMAECFEVLLDGVLTQPEMRVGELPLLTEQQRAQLLYDWNATTVDFPSQSCVHELIEAQVALHPQADAVRFGEKRLSYTELNQRANQLAHYLVQQGVKPDTLVGLCLERSLEMVIGLLGILKAGGAYVPLEPSYPPQRFEYILSDSRAEILLTQRSLKDQLSSGGRKVICLDDAPELQGFSTDNLAVSERQLRPEHLAYVIYTSGSTGQPKGVAVTHRSVCNFLNFCRRAFMPAHMEGAVVSTTIAFDATVGSLYPPLVCGRYAELLRDDETGVEHLKQCLVEDTRSLLFKVTPAHLKAVASLGPFATNRQSRHLLVIAGEQLTEKTLYPWKHEWLPDATFINEYGPTETTVGSSTYHDVDQLTLSPHSLRPIPIGKPLDNVTYYVLNSSGSLQPVGVPGELYIGGPCLAREYLNKPELTQQKFVAHPFFAGERVYRTGDQVRWLASGNIEFIGRFDHQVKIHGFRIELGEIESQLLKLPAVTDTVVLAREDEQGEKRLVAYVVKDANQGVSDNDVIAECRRTLGKSLPDYMVPASYQFVEKIPLTPNGKVDRKALLALDAGQTLQVGYVAPRTAQEEQLCRIWSEILQVEKVGIRDNFFASGGDSILSIQVISRAREQGIEISMRQMFEGQTIEAILAGDAPEPVAAVPYTALPPITAVTHPEYLPLSFSQRRLWIISQVEQQEASYNLPSAILLQGPLSVESLKKAFTALIARHDTLHTVFRQEADKNQGEPYQEILREFDFTLKEIDLSGYDEAEQNQRVKDLADKDAMQVFDLGRDLMIRVTLLKLGEERHVLLLNRHHIASDGWSINILLKELNYFYDAYQQGIEPNLPPLPLQYADYALWQQRWMQGEVLEAHQRYWREALSGIPQLHNLPLDNPRPAQRSYRGAKHLHRLGVAKSQALKQFNQQQGVTLFMTLQAVFATLISRFSGEEDVVIGFSLANRVHQEIEGLIGFFANTLVLRSNLSDNPRFVDFLQATKEHSLTALTHQHLPFELLVEELNPERSLSHSPLFQIMLVVDNNPFDAPSESELSVTAVEQSFPISKFDLSLHVRENPEEGFVLNWGYATDLFAAASIQRMAECFEVLLDGVLSQPELRVGELPLLTEQQRTQLLYDWNATTVDFPSQSCVHELIEAQVALHPQADAVRFGEKRLSYTELNQRANQLAHYLVQQGVKPDTLVGLCLERSLEMVIGLLGILKAGGAYVPLEPSYPPQRFEYILSDSRAEILLTQRSLKDQLSSGGRKVICLDDAPELQGFSTDNLAVSERQLRPEHLAYVIYTSGSTGQPKGVAVTHRSVCNFLNFCRRAFMPAHMEGAVVSTTIAFDATVGSLYPPLVCGRYAELLRDDETGVEHLKQCLVEDTRSLLFKVTPAHLKAVASLGPFATNRQSRHLLVIAGEQLTEKTLYPWKHEWLPDATFINEYGPTETTVGSSTYHDVDQLTLSPHSLRPIPIGKPLDNVTYYVLNSSGSLQPVGVPGELYIGGPCLAREYLNKPELTQQKFVAHPFFAGERVYRTGDQVRWLASGNIEFIGRFDHQVKIHGFRIELGEIESQLLKLPAVTDTVVLAREDEQGEKRLVAYVVKDASQTVSDNDLIAECRRTLGKSLPDYMVPASYQFVEKIPLTPNGKVDRKALLALDAGQTLQVGYVAPRTAQEEQLCRIWSEILQVEKVGIRDNFFASGGDSILSIQVISRAREQGIEISMRQMFEGQTIEAILAGEETSKVQASQEPAVGEQVLLPIQQWFLQGDPVDQQHFNQSMLLQLPAGVGEEFLGQWLAAIYQRHDVLRLSFSHESTWQAHYAPYTPELLAKTLVKVALPQDANARLQTLMTEGEKHKASLHLTAGPLMKVVFFEAQNPQDSRLLITLHHLVVDGVTWRILLDDLARGFRQWQQEREIKLPAKTSAYQQWAEALQDHGTQTAVQAEKSYWLQSLSAQLPPIPVDHDGVTDNRLTTSRRTAGAISPEATKALLRDCPSAYDTAINELLLASLMQAFNRWCGRDRLLIRMEGHGREPLFSNLDISETAGWFTSIYPLLIQLDDARGTGWRRIIKGTKRQVRSVPNNGIGFGLLHYLNRDPEIVHAARHTRYDIAFNYLGQLDQGANDDALFKPAGEDSGSDVSAQRERTYPLKITLAVNEGRLGFMFEYNALQYDAATLEKLSECYTDALNQLVDHCHERVQQQVSLDDFELSPADRQRLTGDPQLDSVDALPLHALEKLNNRLMPGKTLYPMSYSQRMFWPFTELAGLQSVLRTYRAMRLQGRLDVNALREAFIYLVNRHDVFKSHFMRIKQDIVVSIDPALQADFRVIHLFTQNSKATPEDIKAIVAAEINRDYEVFEGPLCRCLVIRETEDTSIVVFGINHLICDRWSWGIFQREIESVYQSLRQGAPITLPDVEIRYGDYAYWNRQWHAQPLYQKQLRYWEETLRGYPFDQAFPTDRNASEGNAGGVKGNNSLELAIPLDLFEALDAHCREQGMTLYTLFMSVFQLTLHRYSGLEQLIVISPKAERNHPKLARTIGVYLNMLIVHSRIDANDSLVVYLERMKHSIVQAQSNMDVHIEALREVVDYKDNHPISEINFQYYNFPEESGWAFAGLQSTPINIGDEIEYANTLDLRLVRTKSGVVGFFVYNPRLFNAASIEGMKHSYLEFLQAVVSREQRALGELLMTENRPAKVN